MTSRGSAKRNPRSVSRLRSRRWGVILAGGDGIRLQNLTRFICGDDRPKQFRPLLDGCTLLGHTVCSAERSIPAAQTLFALAHAHPDVLEGLRRAELWTGSETHIEESAYNKLRSSDFSKHVLLSRETMRLRHLRVRDPGWRDLGHLGRVLDVLEEMFWKKRVQNPARGRRNWVNAWLQRLSADAESAIA
jgi:hypothetical protein